MKPSKILFLIMLSLTLSTIYGQNIKINIPKDYGTSFDNVVSFKMPDTFPARIKYHGLVIDLYTEAQTNTNVRLFKLDSICDKSINKIQVDYSKYIKKMNAYYDSLIYKQSNKIHDQSKALIKADSMYLLEVKTNKILSTEVKDLKLTIIELKKKKWWKKVLSFPNWGPIRLDYAACIYGGYKLSKLL